MTIPILHFSDVLCIFAYAAHIRIDELQRSFPDDVDLQFHFCSVFGDVQRRFAERWDDRGGVQGYAAHVHQVAQRFPHVTIHPEVWTRDTPASSLSPHLFLRAVGVLELREQVATGTFQAADLAVREAFFRDARNVAQTSVQAELAERLGLPADALRAALDSGRAHADLARDLDLVRQHSVTLSPTLLFNEGRQRLNGNVGFRIIEANVRELVRTPEHEASWC
jgi:predicted DsbA family dithiol-disulfide isomerase